MNETKSLVGSSACMVGVPIDERPVFFFFKQFFFVVVEDPQISLYVYVFFPLRHLFLQRSSFQTLFLDFKSEIGQGRRLEIATFVLQMSL